MKNRRQLKNFHKEINREITISHSWYEKIILLKNRFENPGYTLFYLFTTAFGGIPTSITEDLKANGGEVM